ncbi:MAG: twin-arginine translocase subunit TatC [Candidatus Roizmanbacteria bacterium]
MTTKLQNDPLLEGYDRYMPFLSEVRKRVIFIFVIFIIASSIGFIYYENIIRTILGTFDLEGVNIVFTSPFQFVNLAINSAFAVGTIVVFPLLLWQIILFARPALTKQEFKLLILLLPLSVLLFVSGMAFGVLIMKWIIVIFYAKSKQLQIGNFLDVSQLLSQVIMTGVLMGVAFQFPVVLTILLKLKIITYKILAKQRVLAYIISLIFAALLPPTDILSLVLLTIPLIALFELTLVINKYILRTHV